MSHPSTSTGPAVPVIPGNHTIVSIAPAVPEPQLPRFYSVLPEPKLTYLGLLQGSREEYIYVGVPLYEAALKGDWKAAKPILDLKQDLVRFAITENLETMLHIAASARSTNAVEEFVKNLVDFMGNKDDLGLQNKNGDTALSLAAQAGNIEIAKTMVNRNPGLIDIPNNKGLMPLYMAALFANPEMVRYLYGISKNMAGDFWTDANRGWVLQKCVESEIFDVAIKIVIDRPKLTDSKGLLMDVLLALAKNTKAFEAKKPNVVFRIITSFFAVFRLNVGPSEKVSEALHLLRIIWGKIAKLPKAEIDAILRGQPDRVIKENEEKEGEVMPILRRILEKMDTSSKREIEEEKELKMPVRIRIYPSRVLFVAAKMGNTRFLIEIIRVYPDAIWKLDDKGKTVFHLAVKYRQIKIFKLLYEIGAMKDLVTPIKDNKGNNMLHMVAKSRRQKRFENVSGDGFQMQMELLWYKEVEKMIPPSYRQRKNNQGKTPQDLFTETHLELLKLEGDWVKNSASQCMVVSTLIATIAFAAAFTLPGGYNQESGIPFFRKEPSLIFFVISDAVSLISSSTSVLIFLSIFTSRSAEQYISLLPGKLVSGIATLFLSIATMMIAFSASFFVLYNKNLEWMPVTISSLAVIPVALYALLQQGLFRDVIKASYVSNLLFKDSNQDTLY